MGKSRLLCAGTLPAFLRSAADLWARADRRCSVPYPRRPCQDDYEDEAYYSHAPRYVPVPPFAVSFGFSWVFER